MGKSVGASNDSDPTFPGRREKTGLVLLFLLAIFPYLTRGELIELELIAAQPLLRLFLLLSAGVLCGLALRHTAYRFLPLPGLLFLFLTWETASTAGLSLFPGDARKASLRIYCQNIAQQPPSAFADWLSDHSVDLVLLQEVYAGHRAEWEDLAAELGYQALFQELRPDAGMGSLVLSKTALTPLPPVRVPTWGRKVRWFAHACIQYQNRPVEVYSVHLESLPIVRGRRILFGSSALRLRQSRRLVSALAGTDGPAILAGDLNAAPLYPSIRPLRRLLRDAWTEAGLGLGFTCPASFPLSRIDALLHRGFRAERIQTVRLSASDHRGLYAALRLVE